MLTVSPNRQYLGILSPTTAATQGPASNHQNDGVCDSVTGISQQRRNEQGVRGSLGVKTHSFHIKNSNNKGRLKCS